MRYVGPAIVATAALMLAGSAASATSKHHPRYARHVRGPAVQYAPVPNFAPIDRPRGSCRTMSAYRTRDTAVGPIAARGRPEGPKTAKPAKRRAVNVNYSVIFSGGLTTTGV